MRMSTQSPGSSYKKTEQFRRSKPVQMESDLKHKFMQTIGDEMFVELEKIADEKGIKVQTLLRAVVIPEWVQTKEPSMDPRSTPTSAQKSYREKRREDRPQKF
jgi:hypothetical protein